MYTFCWYQVSKLQNRLAHFQSVATLDATIPVEKSKNNNNWTSSNADDSSVPAIALVVSKRVGLSSMPVLNSPQQHRVRQQLPHQENSFTIAGPSRLADSSRSRSHGTALRRMVRSRSLSPVRSMPRVLKSRQPLVRRATSSPMPLLSQKNPCTGELSGECSSKPSTPRETSFASPTKQHTQGGKQGEILEDRRSSSTRSNMSSNRNRKSQRKTNGSSGSGGENRASWHDANDSVGVCAVTETLNQRPQTPPLPLPLPLPLHVPNSVIASDSSSSSSSATTITIGNVSMCQRLRTCLNRIIDVRVRDAMEVWLEAVAAAVR
jgi:hypothetical protein